MNKLHKINKEIIKLFIKSVNIEIDKWAVSRQCAYSKKYDDCYIFVNFEKRAIFLRNTNGQEELVCNYTFFHNIRVNKSVKKLKKYFKQIEIDKKNLSKINFVENCLTKMQDIKEVRKEKLNQINKRVI